MSKPGLAAKLLLLFTTTGKLVTVTPEIIEFVKRLKTLPLGKIKIPFVANPNVELAKGVNRTPVNLLLNLLKPKRPNLSRSDSK